MFEEKYSVFGIPMTVKWFAKKFDWSDLFRFVSYRNYLGDPSSKVYRWFSYTNYTLITDLTADEEQCFGRIRKNVRYEIRRAIREQITYQMNKCSRGEFVEFYNSFAKAKGLSPMRVSMLARYSNHNLVFTQAFREDRLLSAHAYLCDTDKAQVRLQFSPRGISGSEDSQEMKILGWANKGLHWEDIKYFREKGFCRYDWGGYTPDRSNEATDGVHDFKLGFGGEVKEVFGYSSPLARAVGGIRHIVKRCRRLLR